MKNVINFLLFLIYTIVIFQVNNYTAIAIFFLLNVIITFSLKHKIKKVASPHVQIASQSHKSKKLNLVALEKSNDFSFAIKNKPLTNFWGIAFIIVFTTIINIFFVDLKYGILIGIKLLLVCNITYVFSSNISYMEFARIIEKLLTPLKIFKVDPKQISLIICIALTFIPIISREFYQTRIALSAKGIKTKGWHLLKNIKLILNTLILSTFKRIDELEISMNAKGYMEE